MSKRIEINTVFGTLFAEVRGFPGEYPGIDICISQRDEDGEVFERQLVLVEQTPPMDDGKPKGLKTLRACIWGDKDNEDFTAEHLIDVEFDPQNEVNWLKSHGVTFEQLQKELDYRDNAGIKEPEPDGITCGWDDDLCTYTTAELEQIESAWEQAI